jgi:hypothetical protein
MEGSSDLTSESEDSSMDSSDAFHHPDSPDSISEVS